MERLPRRTPSAQMDVVGLVFDAIVGMVEDIPIIGDIVSFVASLFGRSSTANARLSRLEAVVSKGASGTDLFNRVDSSSLGTGPGMPGPWVTGGNGQALGVQGNAAGLVESIAPAQGRRWARYPVVASASAMAVEVGIDDRTISSDDNTTIIVCANEDFTEGIAANLFGVGVYLARFARSGTSWTFTDFAQDTSYKLGRTQSVELRASGSGLYTLWIDGQRVIGGDLPSFPIDAAHRYGGFAIRMNIPLPFVYRYGIRLAVFSLRSESETFTAIESVETIANGAAATANGAATVAAGAQTAAENAVGTAVSQATAAATAAAAAAAATNTLVVQQIRSEIVQLADNIPAIDSWVSMVPGQQVSFPISFLNETVKSISGFTANANATSPHNHSITSTSAPTYTPAANVVEGVWIQSKYSAGRATVSFFIGSGLSSRPPLYVYIGRMTDTGDLVIEYVSPDQTPIITNQLQLVNVTMPEDLLFDFGEWMYVGIHQVGTGTRRAIYCNEMTVLPLDPDAFPKQQKVHFTSTSALTAGSTLPKASQLYSSPYVPWVGIGVRLRTGDPLPRSWFDPFDESMSARWTSVASVGLSRLAASDGHAAFNGTTNGTQRSLYKERVAYDDIIGEWAPVGLTTQIQSYIYHSNSGGTTYMAVEQTSTGTAICRYAAGTRTELATSADSPEGVAYRITVGINSATSCEVHVVEKKLAGSSTWGPAISYPEPTPGALGTRGAGFRYGGLECRRGGFAINSGEFDYWAMRDNVVLEES